VRLPDGTAQDVVGILAKMKHLIRKTYCALVPEFLRIAVHEFIHKDKKVRLGDENPDKHFIAIRCFDRHMGMGAIILLTIKNLMYAKEMGYIPVVDLLNAESQYHDKTAFGKDNAWEYYFEQPCANNYQNISKSKNVVITTAGNGSSINFFKSRNFMLKLAYFEKDPDGIVTECKKYYRQYIKFNKEVKKRLDGDYEKILKDKGKILGVIGRGAEFALKKPKNHRVAPPPAVLLKKVKDVFVQEGFHYVFLATEDCDIYQLFKNEFKDRLLDIGQKRVSSADVEKHSWLADVNFGYGEREKYKLGLDYLSSLYLLSKCNGICGSVTCGAIVAYIMSDGYQYEYFFDLGIY